MKALIWVRTKELKRKKMKINFLLFFIFTIYLSPVFSQPLTEEYSFMFYNVENLFDSEDDPSVSDDEFTPQGARHWRNSMLSQKLLNLSKVILNAAGWIPPQLIGLCEVENRKVLEMLINDTPLNGYRYKVIHKESPDDRGIDVAFLYNEAEFYPLGYTFYPLKVNRDSVLETREILYVKGIPYGKDTLHIFINHWPSRYSGLLETREYRMIAAQTLRALVDDLYRVHLNPKVLIAGDFNDQPEDESITFYLNAKAVSADLQSKEIYNLSANWKETNLGTLKYRSQWYVFDQIIVSGSLLNASTGLKVQPKNASIVQLPFLLEKDKKFGGMKLFRSYTGYRYNGGFSDHLPVLLKFTEVD